MFTVIGRCDEGVIEEQARWIADQNFTRVLDVGGAAKPLRCATHVMDIETYARRRVDEGRGPMPERFTSETWFVRDVCLTPWPGAFPWPDNHFDYVWCSQVVEDVRDPVGVCQEMMRVGKAGFISTVQRQYESSVVQDDGVVGYHHHRWLIEASVQPQPVLTFTFKSPILQVNRAVRPPHNPAKWLLHVVWSWGDVPDRWPFVPKEVFLTEGWMQRDELLRYLERMK